MRKEFAAIGLLITLLLFGCVSGCASGESESRQTAELADLTERLQAAQAKIERLTDAAETAPEVHMIPEEVCGYRMMALENVDVKGIPSENAKTNRRISYQLVDVLIKVHGDLYCTGENSESDLWALILFHQFDSTSDTLGWIPWDQLVPYTEECKAVLTYPVYLAEGCVDLDTGEAVSWGTVGVRYVDGDAIVFWEGGNYHRVAKEYILYPDPDQINAEIR